MAVPTPDEEYLDFTGADWTKTGSPTATIDQHSASNVTYLLDNVNDYYTKATGTTEHFTTGTAMSCTFWFKASADGSLVYEKAGTSGLQAFITGSNTILFQVLSSGSDYLRFTTTTTYVDDVWHHCALTVTNTSTIAVYIDGAAAAGSITSGGSWAGFTTDTATFRHGADHTAADLFGGIISRTKVWQTTALSSAQVLEEYNAECDAVVVPTIDYSYTDFSGSDWTKNGSPTQVDDQHGPSRTYDLDGVDDYLDKATGTIEHFTSGALITVSAWVKTSGPEGRIVNELDATFVKGFQLSLSAGRLLFDTLDNLSNYTRSISTDTIHDGEWHHIVALQDSSYNHKLFIDGSEVGSYVQQSFDTGTGHTGFGADSKTLRVGGKPSGAYLTGTVSRVGLWVTTALSPCQVLKQYNAEVALIGTGFTSGDGGLLSGIYSARILGNITGRVYP